ncbi:TSUP family transporter [Natrialbaceae archaeon AArc-T1-2]|uniref:TSUP family transporter n=1 Tax=Natrialbaceae archaeon AArc-T1-2 TaxID=3053904 RepID=UPI00255A7C4A|nr:TSUP family transporter [Natrialbaceae archaeon AArc-T1-2]WIV67030.1 TSUP family transporter [Natrialbaceae archaeon AArc-T1-2]
MVTATLAASSVYTVAGIELTAFEAVLALGILLLGGFVKGTVGFAVGLITVAGLVQVFPPQIALVALSIPFFVSNVVVLAGDGVPVGFLREQIPFVVALVVGLFAGVWLLTVLSPELLYLFIAGYVMLFLGFQHVEERIQEHASSDSAGAFSGSLSGLLGGAVSAPGPPLVIHTYLNTITDRRAVFVTGVSALFLIAHAVRVLFLARAGLLHVREILLGAVFTVPIFVGVTLGIAFRPHIDDETFTLLIKVLLAVIGIRLLLNGFGW